MTRELVVVGAGGFGREALDVAEAAIAAGATFRTRGVVDSNPSELSVNRLAARGVELLGTEWRQHLDAEFIIGIGNPDIRSRIAAQIAAAGGRFATIVHPASTIGSSASVGAGVVVCAGVAVSTNVVLEDHVHLNPNATVGHDAVLSRWVSVNPGAIVSGEVRVGEGALIGAGAVVLQGLSVGEHATVGAMACVIRDVPPGTIVKGVPAR